MKYNEIVYIIYSQALRRHVKVATAFITTGVGEHMQCFGSGHTEHTVHRTVQFTTWLCCVWFVSVSTSLLCLKHHKYFHTNSKALHHGIIALLFVNSRTVVEPSKYERTCQLFHYCETIVSPISKTLVSSYKILRLK